MGNVGRSNKKKWLLISLSIVVLAAGGGGWYYVSSKANQVKPMVTNTAQVKQGSIKVSVGGSGVIASAERQTLKGGDGGKIKTLSIKQGDHVTKGQELIVFEGKDVKDSLNQEQLSLQKKQMDLDAAQQALKDNTDETKIEDMKLNIKKQMLDIDLSKSKIQSLLNDQKPPAPVVSPIDGDVLTLNSALGDQVTGNTTIGEIVNYDNLKLDIEVDEMDVLKIKEGLPADVTVDASPGNKFSGVVTKVAKEGTAKNGVSVFVITLSVTGGTDTTIKAGMSARADIKIEEKQNILVVPIEAVQQRQGKSYVMVEELVDTAGAASASAEPNKQAGSDSTASTHPEASSQPSGTNGEGHTGVGNSTGQSSQSGQFRQRGQGQQGQNQQSGSGQSQASGGQSQAQAGQMQPAQAPSGQSQTMSRPTTGAQGTGTSKLREVQVGIHNESLIEIVSGLKPGEKVILPATVSSSNQQAKQQVMMIDGARMPAGGGAGGQGQGFTRSSGGGNGR
ncbi:efflux RND transporter periplasmic adaptor subunit [Paenibacillus sp. N1-5-1-14]|uniref:efflux RND transporter periplasmic adaptor subunit n=1 Tax=Paenibacillus radicibacter TaxID=2972488 RepID=UPI002159375A|nr:efflux RND transporter periplasmic adaptor subunit [Paenibacillus radicibacter]MCR8644011.1 efflux RND transporter periplasmic adaptor subunit [Paenibacillus radicibacter]